MEKHNCRDTGKLGEFLYICSRCGKCYCKHKAIYLDQENRWAWRCPDGKIRPVINDGRLNRRINNGQNISEHEDGANAYKGNYILDFRRSI